MDRAPCPGCGRAVSLAARVCGECGRALEAATETPRHLYCLWEEREGNILTRCWITWKRILVDPGQFVRKLPRTSPIWRPIQFAVLGTAWVWIPYAIFLAIAGAALTWSGEEVGTMLIAAAGVGTVALWRVTTLLVGSLAWWYHSTLQVFGGRGAFRDALRLVAYGWGMVSILLDPCLGLPILLLAVFRLWLSGSDKLYGFAGPSVVIAFGIWLLPSLNAPAIRLPYPAPKAFGFTRSDSSIDAASTPPTTASDASIGIRSLCRSSSPSSILTPTKASTTPRP
jgi:hypothetical protein